MIGYKLFRIKKQRVGQLFTLYVLTDDPVPMHTWLTAQEGPRTADGKRVKSRLGELAFRPGWHLSDIPLAVHIGRKDSAGVIRWMHDDEIWCECEYSDEVDYQPAADLRGMRNGKYVSVKAMLDYIPLNGFYRYRTSPQMLGKWVIAGSMRVNRILSDEEVSEICQRAGYQPLPHKTVEPYSWLGDIGRRIS